MYLGSNWFLHTWFEAWTSYLGIRTRRLIFVIRLCNSAFVCWASTKLNCIYYYVICDSCLLFDVTKLSKTQQQLYPVIWVQLQIWCLIKSWRSFMISIYSIRLCSLQSLHIKETSVFMANKHVHSKPFLFNDFII